MRGDVIVFANGPESTRLLGALGHLAEMTEFDFVLIGGLAVAARLETFHRATQDLDALIDDDRDHFRRATVRAVASARIDADTLSIGGVTIDIIDIDTATPYDAIAELDEPLDRLFTGGHLFAHHDASPLEIRAGSRHATIRVASPRSLLVTKLHAYLSPRRSPNKRASDALDIYALGRQLAAGAHDAALEPPPRQVALIASWALRQIQDRPEEIVRHLAATGVTARTEEIAALMEILQSDLMNPS